MRRERGAVRPGVGLLQSPAQLAAGLVDLPAFVVERRVGRVLPWWVAEAEPLRSQQVGRHEHDPDARDPGERERAPLAPGDAPSGPVDGRSSVEEQDGRPREPVASDDRRVHEAACGGR